jgi:hypothetical protein
MKKKDVKIHEQYYTRVGGQLVPVQVVAQKEQWYGPPTNRRSRTVFLLLRVDTGRDLPKPRTAAALRQEAP